MTDDPRDPWRLRAALAGDVDAWTSIVDEFGGTIWRWARSYRLSREDAEDVCQNVWYQLRDKGDRIDDPRALPGWLATTTRRAALSMVRRRQRAGDAALSLDADDGFLSESLAASTDVHEELVGADLRRRLVDAFARLGERCRELLALLWERRLPYSEVADTLGIALGSVGPTKKRCLDQLRNQAGVES